MEIYKPHKSWFNKASLTNRNKELFDVALSFYKEYEKSIKNSFHLEEKEFIESITVALNTYKDEIDQLKYKKAFNAQTKFHSSIHEEFWVSIGEYLVKNSNLEDTDNIYIGAGQGLQGLYFSPNNLKDLETVNLSSLIKPKFKDRDFMIALKVDLSLLLNNEKTIIKTSTNRKQVCFPLVSIECKQYIDKTMLDNAFNAANKLKTFAPYSYEAISIEFNKLSDVNILGTGIDSFFVLRKQKLSQATFRKGEGPSDTVDINKRNKIDSEVVFKAYKDMERHFTKNFWVTNETDFLSSGILFN